MAESVSKLREQIQSLTGVDIMLDAKNFKSTYQIVKDLAAVWKDLSDVTQANVLNLIGGKRNANVVSSLLTNFSDAEAAMKTAMDATGSAARENEAYLDSIQGKLSILTAKFQELSNSLIGSGWIKGAVDAANILLSIVNWLSRIHELLPAIIVSVVALRGLVNSFNWSNILSMGIGNFTAKLASKGFADVFGSIATSLMSGFKTVGGAFSLGLAGVTAVIGAVMAGIEKGKQLARERIEKANEVIEKQADASKTYKSNVEAIDSLKSRYYELTDSIDQNADRLGLSESQYEEYLGIIRQLVDISPSIASGYTTEEYALKNYKTAIVEATRAQEDLYKAEMNSYIAGGSALFGGKSTELSNIKSGERDAFRSIGSTLPTFGFGYSKYNEFQAALEEIGAGKYDKNNLSVENVDALIDGRSRLIALLRETNHYTEEELATISESVYKLAEFRDQRKEIIDEEAEYLSQRIVYEDNEGLFGDLSNEQINAMRDGIAGIIDPTKSVSQNMAAAEKYAISFVQSLNDASNTVNSGDSFVELPIKEVGDSAEESAKSVDKLTNSLKAFRDSMAIIQAAKDEMLSDGGLSSDTFASIYDQLTDGEYISDYISEENGMLQLNVEAWEKRSKAMLNANHDDIGRQISEYDARITKIDELRARQAELISEVESKRLSAKYSEISPESTTAAEYKKYYGLDISSKQEFVDIRHAELEAAELELASITEELRDNETAAINDAGKVERLREEYNILSVILNQLQVRTVSDVLGDVDDVVGKSKGINDMLESVKDGVRLTKDELLGLAADYPSLFVEHPELFNSDSLEGDKRLLSEINSLLQDQYNLIISTRISDLRKDLGTADGERVNQINAEIAALQTLQGIDLSSFITQPKEAAKSMSDYLSDAESGMSMLKKLAEETRDPFSEINGILSMLGEGNESNIQALIAGVDENGIIWKTDELKKWTKYMIDASISEDQFGEHTQEVRDWLYDFATSTNEAEKSVTSFADAISAVQSVSSLLTDIQSGNVNLPDTIAELKSMADNLNSIKFNGNENWSWTNFFEIGSGTGVNISKEALRAYSDAMIDAAIADDEAAQTFFTNNPDLLKAWKDQAAAAVEAKTALDSLSNVKSGIGLLGSLTGDENALDQVMSVLQEFKDIEGYDINRLITGVNDGEIDWDIDAVRDYARANADAAIAEMNLGENAEKVKKLIYDLIDAEIEAAKETNVLASAFDEISGIKSNASSISGYMDSVKSGTRLTQEQLFDLKSSYVDLFVEKPELFDSDSLEGDKQLLSEINSLLQEQYLQVIRNKEAELNQSLATAKSTGEMKKLGAQMRGLKKLEAVILGNLFEQTEKPIDKLENVLSIANSGEGLIGKIVSEQNDDGINSLDTISSLIDQVGEKWVDMVSFTANGPIIDTQSVLNYYIDQVNGLTDVDDALKNLMVDSLNAAAQLKEQEETISDAYDKMGSAISNASYVDKSEISYSDYEKLIEADKRYSNAIEYANGVLTVNKQKYEDVTRAILQETKAKAASALQAKIANGELDAEALGYASLIVEIENAESAINKFKRATSNVNAEDFDTVQDAMEVINNTLYNDSSDIFRMVGRDQFTYAVEMLVGPDIEIDTPEWEAAFNNVRKYITDNGVDFQHLYDDLFSNGFIVDGELTGTLDDAAESLGITRTALKSLFDQWNQYLTQDQKIKYEVDTGDLESDTKTAEEQLADLQRLVDEYVKSLGNADGAPITVNTEQAEEDIGRTTESVEELKVDVDEVGVSGIDIDTSVAENNIDSLNTKISSLIDNLTRLAKSWTVNIKTNSIGNTTTLGSLLGSSTKNLFGKSNASGTMNFSGGNTLVGELGRELVVNPNTNKWYTVGNHGAEFVNLPRGAIVFNNMQTEKLLRTHKINSQGSSMASGNALAFSNPVVDIMKSLATNSKTRISGGLYIPKGPGTNSDKTPVKQVKELAEVLDDIKNKYDGIDKQYSHLIEHQKQLFDDSERMMDYSSMVSILSEQIKIYKKNINDVQAAIDEMLKAGADDSMEQLQELEKQKWSLQKEMFDTIEQMNSLYLQKLNDQIDGIQAAYDKLKTAADEYNENGFITIDTFQDLSAIGLQYMGVLDKVGEKYVVNEEALNKLLEAQTEQLAVDTALAYINDVTSAAIDGNSNKLQQLLAITVHVTGNTWDLVDAKLAEAAALGLTNTEYDILVTNVNKFRRAAEDLKPSLSAASEMKSQKNSIDYILNKTKELVKYETNERIDSLNDQKKAFKELVDLKKEMIKQTKEEAKYEDQVAEKVKDVAKLQAQIDKLSLDTSRDAAVKRAQLMEDLAAKQKELDEIQADHAYDLQTEALDKMNEDNDERIDAEIETLQSIVSSDEKVFQIATQRIKEHWDTLYEDLIAWNTEAGSVLNQEITAEWERAFEAAKKYGDYLTALSEIDNISSGESVTFPNSDAEMNAVRSVVDATVKSIYKDVDFRQALGMRLNTEIGDVNGTSAAKAYSIDSLVESLNKYPPSQSIVFSPTINVDVSGVTDAGNAEMIGRKVGTEALNAMYEGFARKGISSPVKII